MSKLNDLLFTPVCEIDQNNPNIKRACKLMVRTRPFEALEPCDFNDLPDDMTRLVHFSLTPERQEDIIKYSNDWSKEIL